MSEHLNDYNKIHTDLQNLDVDISDEDKAFFLLNSRSDTYDNLITTLLYGNDEIKFDDVTNALANNEYNKKAKQGHRDAFRGMSNNKKVGKDECAYCHNKGHWKKDCPLLRNEDKKDSDANVLM